MSYQFADINGVRMHFDQQGSGPDLVLLHAGIANLGMWDEQMDAFGTQFRVLRHDIRGWGQTPDPAGDYRDHDDLKSLMTHLGVKRANILGISNGGRIAIDFSIAFPEMVDKLVLVAPALGGFDYPDDAEADRIEALADTAASQKDFAKAAEYEAALWAYGPTRSAKDVAPEFRKRALGFIRETLETPEGEGQGHMLEPRAAGRLDEIRAETLLLFGDKDIAQMEAVVRELDAKIERSKLVLLPNVAHLPNMENPEAFNRIVLDFLQE
jgi:pimeloyl-ACP methyl ester carboxylesterase